MCGLIGFLGLGTLGPKDSVNQVLSHMAQAIKSRGPDAYGAWVNPEACIALAHQRLAIVDLTPAGSQPMVGGDGRYILVFNGEIYNHLELRRELNSHRSINWRGLSDTETLITAFETWGVEATLPRVVGMFAFALWDQQQRILMLGRDRFGEKPLYYGWQGQGRGAVFLFGSELSALRRHPAFVAPINRNSLSLFLRHNCIGGAQSIYQGIHKLLPGHLLTVSARLTEPKIWGWWLTQEIIQRSLAQPFMGSPKEAVDTLEVLLLKAVGGQMMGDVPVGAFLSGGIDSSTVVALMQAQSSVPVKTFSIGFTEDCYNEAKYAKAVAQHLGTEHSELYVTAQQAQDVIIKLPTLYAEPFADSSQIATYLVSHLARKHVTVSLSGDAGDELFCGYSRYQIIAKLWKKLRYIPKPFRHLIATSINSLSANSWNALGGQLNLTLLGDKLHKSAALLDSASLSELYRSMVSHLLEPDTVVLNGHEPAKALLDSQVDLAGLDDFNLMMASDMLGYLPDDILVKVDRAAMGVSLETRMPMLDHRVVEFAWSLPQAYKFRDGLTKWPLRQVLKRHIPPELIDRPKMGFGVPIDQWLRQGVLRDWAETLLNESRLRQEGFFNPLLVRQRWTQHLSGQRNWGYQIWDILMFQAWLEAQ